MRGSVVALLIAASVACVGCNDNLQEQSPALSAVVREVPIVNVPQGDRQANWPSSAGEGSCSHASIISLLRWCGEYNLAAKHREKYEGGEYIDSLLAELNDDKISHASCRNGDFDFLSWCIRTRRGAAITWMGGRHMLCIVDINDGKAGILDNNSVEKITWVPLDRFRAEWNESGGVAISLLYAPAAPLGIGLSDH